MGVRCYYTLTPNTHHQTPKLFIIVLFYKILVGIIISLIHLHYHFKILIYTVFLLIIRIRFYYVINALRESLLIPRFRMG